MTKPGNMIGTKIQKALDKSKERVIDRDKDFVGLVTGGEGNGKSSLAVEMARYVDQDFDVEKQVAMSYEDVIRTADELDPGQALVIDEGIEMLLSRNHAKKKNKIILEWFREVRAKNLFFFICMPKFKEVDKPIRDDRAHTLVRCVGQGRGHFFNKSKMDEITVERQGNRVVADFPDPLFKDTWQDPSGHDFWNDYEEMKKENVDNLSAKYLDDEDGEEQSKEEAVREVKVSVAKALYSSDMEKSVCDLTHSDVGRFLDAPRPTVSDWINNQ